MLANDKDGNKLQYARTGYLGFVKRTELTQTDGGELIFYVIILEQSLMLLTRMAKNCHLTPNS